MQNNLTVFFIYFEIGKKIITHFQVVFLVVLSRCNSSGIFLKNHDYIIHKYLIIQVYKCNIK